MPLHLARFYEKGGDIGEVQDMWGYLVLHTCVPDTYDRLIKRDNFVFPSNSKEGAIQLDEHAIPSPVPEASGRINAFSCPTGFNLRKVDAVLQRTDNDSLLYSPYALAPETQELYCAARGGSFNLTWGDLNTPPILSTTSIPQLQFILQQAFPSMGKVKLSSTHTAVCTGSRELGGGDGATTTIIFLSLHSPPIPLITVQTNQLEGRAVRLITRRKVSLNTAFVEECSGHGVCDTSVGECRCWDGWGSSEGLGGEGTHGDCGRWLKG